MIRLKDLLNILDGSKRLHVLKGEEPLYMGYKANIVHEEKIEEVMDAEVLKFSAVPELKHKQWKEKGLMKPLEPDIMPLYSFSDLQMQLYYTIYL